MRWHVICLMSVSCVGKSLVAFRWAAVTAVTISRSAVCLRLEEVNKCNLYSDRCQKWNSGFDRTALRKAVTWDLIFLRVNIPGYPKQLFCVCPLEMLVRIQYLLTVKVFSLWGEESSSEDIQCWSGRVFQHLLTELWSGALPDRLWKSRLLFLNGCWGWFLFRSPVLKNPRLCKLSR